MEYSRRLFDELSRSVLSIFIGRCFHLLKSGEDLKLGWPVSCMAWHLEEVLAGRCKRLIINVPPRHLKSISASVAFPAFALGTDPSTTITLVCYSQELGDKMMRDLREVMECDWYRTLFPMTRLKHKRANEITTTRHGGVNMTSVRGTLTGRGSDIIIIDDPLKPSSALSDVEREQVNEWLKNTLFSRLNDKRTGRIVIAMQRLHEDDVTGHLTQEADNGWTSLVVPAIAPENARYRISNVEGREWYDRREGSVIDPDREDLADLERIKADIGSLYFSAQYQQEPLPREGNLVKREWFKWYDPETTPKERFDAIVASWDTASEVGSGNDYSVGTVWGLRGEDAYLIWVYRQRLNYPSLRKKIHEVYQENNVDLVLLERADSGRHLAQDLEIDRMRILSIPPKNSKEDRMAAASFLIEGGRVYLPDNAPWLGTFLHELLGFPGTKFDDQVDSTSQFLNWLRKGKRRLDGTTRSDTRQSPSARRSIGPTRRSGPQQRRRIRDRSALLP